MATVSGGVSDSRLVATRDSSECQYGDGCSVGARRTGRGRPTAPFATLHDLQILAIRIITGAEMSSAPTPITDQSTHPGGTVDLVLERDRVRRRGTRMGRRDRNHYLVAPAGGHRVSRPGDTYIVSVRANDTTGNVSTPATTTFTVDRTGPGTASLSAINLGSIVRRIETRDQLTLTFSEAIAPRHPEHRDPTSQQHQRRADLLQRHQHNAATTRSRPDQQLGLRHRRRRVGRPPHDRPWHSTAPP